METTTKTALTWLQTATGYRRSDSRAELVRGADGRWTLKAAGREILLPRRAGFGHADRIMGRLAVEGAL